MNNAKCWLWIGLTRLGRFWDSKASRAGRIKMIRKYKNSWIAVLIAVCAAGFFWGCETGGDSVALTVSPSEATIAGTSNVVVTFTVGGSTNATADSGLRTLSLPLEWRVSNPGLGYISGASGTSATYIRYNVNGVNTIHVEDQYGAEGSATVSQQ